MANNSQDTILAAFDHASGNPSTGSSQSGNLGGGLLPTAEQSLTDALAQATQAISGQTQALGANTDALAQNSTGRGGSSAAATAGNVLNTASEVLGGGLSLLPLVSLFSGLFGGGQRQEPAPLTQFALPPTLDMETTTSNQSVSWGENGLPRTAGGTASSAPSQVTVQVQAMDSQSFLDHSEEIAQAVRQAMLNMSSINDVVNSL